MICIIAIFEDGNILYLLNFISIFDHFNFLLKRNFNVYSTWFFRIIIELFFPVNPKCSKLTERCMNYRRCPRPGSKTKKIKEK